MDAFLDFLQNGALNGLAPGAAALLLAMSLLGSFITASLGLGGGILLLAVMASFMPAAALIPVHGVIQLGSNFFRAVVLLGRVHWKPVGAFLLGSIAGVAIGGSVAIQLPPAVVRIAVGAFVLWSVFRKPPAWLSRAALPTGLISSILTMFFGATGPFVAAYTKSLTLPRQEHVATNAVLMTVQHLLKTATFAVLGFAFGPWALFIAAMIAMGFIGTLLGKQVLMRFSDRGFKRALDILLVLIALRLVVTGVLALI
ncbi:sulfite exporter TauE/SafE family protein [Oceanicola sp. S124]|uniref:sulfite exporter TauE/SafE family protein n=1 Tax=Oceanicola sp. S124 TaxID=1042378 RepID=UPI00025593B9|nr:sulfite exporter TauE/SafE family protein [Oceanicola sp. S124]